MSHFKKNYYCYYLGHRQCDQIGRFFALWAATILPKLPTLLGNFCKGVKIIHFSSEIIFGQLFIEIWRFLSGHTVGKIVLLLIATSNHKGFDFSFSTNSKETP